jgi:hypothetical protein
MLISIKQSGNFNKIDKFFKRVAVSNYLNIFEKYGREGVSALASATPIDSGKTVNSWDYKISKISKGVLITWTNSNVVDGVPIAIILQYGHGTRNGGYVQGRDYINPAIRPIFDKISADIWREVTAI